MIIFRFKTIEYLSGIETSPGNLGEAGTSIVSLAFSLINHGKNIISIPFHRLIGMGKLKLLGSIKNLIFIILGISFIRRLIRMEFLILNMMLVMVYHEKRGANP